MVTSEQEAEKKAERAKRFGVATSETNLEKMAERAKRFGVPLGNQKWGVKKQIRK